MKRNAFALIAVAVAVTLMILAGQHLVRKPGTGPALSGPGASAPEFALQTLDGNTLRLADLRGKAVLLNFWATWCPPCKEEIPWFVELQKQYGPQGLQIVGVAMDDAGHDAIAKFAADMKIDYPVLLGTDQVADQYGGVEALPTTFYIGRDGKVVARVFGLTSHKDIEENIRLALAKGQPAVASTPAESSVAGAAQSQAAK